MPFITAHSHTGTFTFDTVFEYTAHSQHDTFHTVRVDGEEWEETDAPPLPPRLQVLYMTGRTLTRLPELPVSIREVHVTHGILTDVPDLSHLPHLELLNLEDNNIRHMCNPLPDSLRTLNVAYNQLTSITTPLPSNLVSLNCSFNHFEVDPQVPQGCYVYRDHMYSSAFEYATTRRRIPIPRQEPQRPQCGVFRRRASPVRQAPPASQPTIYASAQNVHADSVQRSVSSSVETLLRMCPKHARCDTFAIEVLALFRKRRRILFWRTGYERNTPPVLEWCVCNTVSSAHGITFGCLLQMVWTVIKHHTHSAQLQTILKDELRASMGHCFTGRFSRVLNVLTGFVDGVGVGISEEEQMQSRIAQAVHAGGPCVKQAIARILDEFGVTDERMRRPWLDAASDFL